MATGTLMSAEQFDQLPVVEGRRTELIDGEIVEVSSATALHNKIQAAMLYLIMHWLQSKRSGSVQANTEFAVGNDRFQPDLAVFTGDRLNQWDLLMLPVGVLPEIAVEIISPSESAIHVDYKCRMYLKHGVKEVWLVFLDEPHIYIHTADSVRRLEQTDTLTTPLLPGWSLAVGDAFSL